MTDRVRSLSSRSGQALCWLRIAEIPLQGLTSAVALVLCIHRSLSCLVMMNGEIFSPPRKGILCVQKMGRNNRSRDNRGTAFTYHEVCRLRSWGGSRLGAHTNLDRVRKGRVCVKVGIIVAVTGGSSRVTGKSIKLALRRENPNSGQRFRASGELEGDRDPVCPGLGSSFLRTSEITYWRHGKDGLVTGFFIFSSSHWC